MYRIYGNKKESDTSPFSDVKEAERFFSLLMCNWNSVAAPMQYATFELLLEDTGDCWESFAKYWAGGFVMGMSLSDSAFDKILKAEKESFLLTPIFALSHDKSFSIENVIEEEMTPDLRKELAAMLPNNIPVICSLLKDPKFAAKISKNDACSCGSKTKHSKCKTKRTLH